MIAFHVHTIGLDHKLIEVTQLDIEVFVELISKSSYESI
jgi:hypothetical protein